jgi:hypothetical protein
MNKGIVMQLDSKHMVVMTADGQFCKVRRRSDNEQIGEEVYFPNTVTFLKRKSIQAVIASSAAAVLLFVIFTSSLGGSERFKENEVAAYVTLDINPSIELGINGKEIVIEARGINEDGLKLLSGMDVEGSSLDAATDIIMNEVDEQGYLSKEDGDIVISSTLIHENTLLDKKELSQKVKQQVSEAILVKHPESQATYPVTALETPKELRNAALSKGISTSKMALYLQAKSEGEEISLEELQHKSIHAIVKKHANLEKIVKKSIATKKELSKLLDDEKQGKLNQGQKQDKDDAAVPAVKPVKPVKSKPIDKPDSIKKFNAEGKSSWDKDKSDDKKDHSDYDKDDDQGRDNDKGNNKDRDRDKDNNRDRDNDQDNNNRTDQKQDDEKLSSQKNPGDIELVSDKKLEENERQIKKDRDKAIKLRMKYEKELEDLRKREEKTLKKALEKAKEAAERKKQDERKKEVEDKQQEDGKKEQESKKEQVLKKNEAEKKLKEKKEQERKVQQSRHEILHKSARISA